MKEFFTRNSGWKLMSLAAAVLLWMAVANEPELSTFVSVPVEYKNLSSAVEISSDVVETELLEVRGPSLELHGLPEARPRYAVILDMSDVGPGQHTFTIERANVRLPRGIQLVRAIPAQIRLTFERSAERPVPVDVRLPPSLPPDLQVVEARPEPAQLMVAGPVSRVMRVHSVETDAVPLKPEKGTQEFRVSAYVADPHVRIQDSPEVTVKVIVKRK